MPNAKQATFNYYGNRSDSSSINRNPEKVTKQKRSLPRAVQHLPSLLVLILILLGLIFMSTLSPKVKLIINDENNTTFRNEQSYVDAANAYIGASIINRSKFLFDSNGLEAEMKRQFPEIAVASASAPLIGRRPVLELQTTRPALLLASESSTVLVGNNGLALANLSDVQDKNRINVPTVEDQTGLKIEIGKAALPQEQAVFISTVVEQLEKQSIQVDRLTIPTSPYDLHVRIKGEKYFIKFNILEDPKQQAGSFITLKRSLDSQNKKPNEYIDVRAGERVFYK